MGSRESPRWRPKLKSLRDTGLPQDRVGSVPGQDSPVDRKTPSCDRSVPGFMVPLPGLSKYHPFARRISFTLRMYWLSEGQDAAILVLIQHRKTCGPLAENTIHLQQL